MPVVVMPSQTAERLKPRILSLCERIEMRMFMASEYVLELQFTDDEIEAFGGEIGPAVVLAMADFSLFADLLPAQEDRRLNYIEVVNTRVRQKLDPYF